MHLREVVATGDLGQHVDQRLRGIAVVGVLLRESGRVLDLVGRAPAGETGRRQPLADREAADEALELLEQLVLRAGDIVILIGPRAELKTAVSQFLEPQRVSA